MGSSFIVADAGGTSTQWRVVVNDKIKQYETIGFNAYTHNLNDLKTSIRQTLGVTVFDVPTHFYAAGIATQEQKNIVSESLAEIFHADLFIENDLVGVARSLCGRSAGNACILGTGSNACYYDGASVSNVSASLGYVLGDEGSGADMGKRLLMGVFREHFSTEILADFHSTYGFTSHDVIHRIYSGDRPNHFLSSFSRFILERISHPEMYRLAKEAFESFFEGFFQGAVNTVPFSFSGSIAWYFSDILRAVAQERGYHVQKIVQSPIAGLVLYHQDEN